MNKFSLIAHKPGINDGHFGIYYPDECNIHSHITEEELIRLISAYKTKLLDWKEIGYTLILVTILENELVTFEDFIASTQSISESGTDYWMHENIQRIKKAIDKNIENIYSQRAQEKIIEEHKKEEARKKNEELNDRREFERLKRKLGE